MYHITENGKKVTIQYDADYFADYYTTPGSVIQPQYLLADATPGVLYAKRVYTKNYYDYTQLWVSFDYGRNWVMREENIGTKGYFSANVEGLIYRTGFDGYYKSKDYGANFNILEIGIPGGEPGLQEKEAFGTNAYSPYQGRLLHTYDLLVTYTEIPIDSQFIFGQIGGLFPDAYRGGKEGEVYIHSWFPEYPGLSYKASFSADTGHTFRHVYVNENYQWQNSLFDKQQLLFMSDREPGVFYILNLLEEKDTDPWGWHLKLCVHYYRDYGETLVDIYCHDINKDYKNEDCEPVNDLTSEIINNNSIFLIWTEPEENLQVEGYKIFRNDALLTEHLITNTFYLDENLPNGNYEYFVITHYTNGCISNTSNHVEETIDLGIDEIEEMKKIVVYPNPAFTTITIEASHFIKVEIYNFVGQLIEIKSTKTVDVSSYNSGIYFFKIFDTNNNTVTKRVVVLR